MLVVFGVCRRQSFLDIRKKGDDYEKPVARPPLTTGKWIGHMPIHFYDKFKKPLRTEYWTCKLGPDGKYVKISKKGVLDKVAVEPSVDADLAGGASGAAV